jgi:DNA-directed RNA polymerase specialized sigma24 family protein
MDGAEFSDFLQALRDGDSQAAERLDQLYGPWLCQLSRPWLASSGLRQASDSSDLCQLVFLKFFTALRTGRYLEMRTPIDLERILSHIAKNSFRDLWRKEHLARRQDRLPPPRLPSDENDDLTERGSSPSQHVAREELVQLFLDRLSGATRQIYQWRNSGWDWARIGAELAQPPNTVRIRFERDCKRVARELGLEA